MRLSRNGGVTEARKRVLAQLPINAQSYSSSPYLDLSLFSYEEKWVSVMERPKVCGDHPIQFYGRESGLLKFRLHPGNPGHARLLYPQQGRCSVHVVGNLISFTTRLTRKSNSTC